MRVSVIPPFCSGGTGSRVLLVSTRIVTADRWNGRSSWRFSLSSHCRCPRPHRVAAPQFGRGPNQMSHALVSWGKLDLGTRPRSRSRNQTWTERSMPPEERPEQRGPGPTGSSPIWAIPSAALVYGGTIGLRRADLQGGLDSSLPTSSSQWLERHRRVEPPLNSVSCSCMRFPADQIKPLLASIPDRVLAPAVAPQVPPSPPTVAPAEILQTTYTNMPFDTSSPDWPRMSVAAPSSALPLRLSGSGCRSSPTLSSSGKALWKIQS